MKLNSHEIDVLSESSADQGRSVFDPSALDHLNALPESRRSSLIERVFGLFERSCVDQMQRMWSAFRSGDPDGVRMGAHTLKSSCGQVGAWALHDIFLQIEARANDDQDVEQLLQAADSCYVSTQATIDRWRAT